LAEVDAFLASPEVASDSGRVRALVKERRALLEPAAIYARWSDVDRRLVEAEELVAGSDADPELREMARSELTELVESEKRLALEIQELLLLDDADRSRDVIVELRAGTGGEEAALFAGDLFRMYTLYAQEKGWKVELIEMSKTDRGGMREVIFSVRGKDVYHVFKFESGGHRVQRVPVTEASGRIHTSAATVAVLPEVEDVEVEIKTEDLRIDKFCASGPGGQHVNKTESAIRITHLPTGVVVSCQDEKSQHRNKDRAMRVLRSRLYDMQKRQQEEAVAKNRREQIGSGDRTDRIRTYNWPQNRITDHRIGLSVHQLQAVLDGKLELLIDPLLEWDKQERMKKL
jgi:peptide chain release factor 1